MELQTKSFGRKRLGEEKEEIEAQKRLEGSRKKITERTWSLWSM